MGSWNNGRGGNDKGRKGEEKDKRREDVGIKERWPNQEWKSGNWRGKGEREEEE